ncbi:MAG: hypothetical protein JO246_14225 [Frankiaceae bacterium]|nr:hypothetical protein [Frankiaceae bacterium]
MLQQGNAYFVQHYRLVFRAGLIELAISTVLAAVAAFGMSKLGQNAGQVSKRSVWFAVLRSDRPSGQVPWVHVHLKSGADFWGFVGYYSAEMPQIDRELSLVGPDLQFREKGDGDIKPLDDNWKSVIIAASEVEYLKVNYVPNT